MTDIEIATEQHQLVADLLREEKMLAAIAQMKLLAQEALDWNLKSELENMEVTYRSMLQFLSQGMEDQERGRMYRNLITKGMTLNDRLLRSVYQQTSSILYHQTLRQVMKHSRMTNIYDAVEWMKQSLDNLYKEIPEAREKRLEELEINFFNLLWTSDIWSNSEREAITSLMNMESMPERMSALFVSAVTLAFLEMYDLQKYIFLLDIYTHASNIVRQRAVVGVVLGCMQHDNRMRTNPEVMFRVENLAENNEFVSDVKLTQMHILQSCETERISKFMNEEFIPEMMKNPLLNKDKTGLDELATDETFNPEWEKWIVSKKVKSKLDIMNQLHHTGADIHMASFAHMKNFPFFRTISNWFLPFDPLHSAISEVTNKVGTSNKAVFNLIASGSGFCDSDNYSLYLFLSSMPEATMKMMGANLPNIDEGMVDELKDVVEKGNESESINRMYIQSLYRFFKLFSRKHEFKDIFEEEPILQYCETLLAIVKSPEHIHDLAMFLFNNKHYQEAEEMYLYLEEETIPTAEIAQKRGFCLQQQRKYEEAIEQYYQADLMQPENLWNLIHLAQCYQNVGNFSQAIQYYQRAEKISPDDLNLLLQLGNCLAKQEYYDEAFKRFFKVHYLDEKSIRVWRAIAWYSLMAGKMEQAEHFYNMIEQNGGENNPNDLFNIGHMHWVANRYQQALGYYEKCYNLCGEEDFREMMMSDSESLMWMNVPPFDLPMIIDIVKVNNENK